MWYIITRENARNRDRAKVLGTFTVFHSTPDSEVKDLVNLGFWVFSGVVPIANPQAPPGARYLETEKTGVQSGAKANPSPAGMQAQVPAQVGQWNTPRAGDMTLESHPSYVTCDRSLGLPVRGR